MRTALLWLAAVYVFGAFYYMVEQKESLRQNGQTVYLALDPKAPPSPVQDDAILVSYLITTEMNPQQTNSPSSNLPPSGAMVLSLDEQNIGHFVRIHRGGPLAPHEHLLKFRYQDWQVILGSEKYPIIPGNDTAYAQAAFGQLKVAPDGSSLLVALCDKDRKPITPLPTDSGSPK